MFPATGRTQMLRLQLLIWKEFTNTGSSQRIKETLRVFYSLRNSLFCIHTHTHTHTTHTHTEGLNNIKPCSLARRSTSLRLSKLHKDLKFTNEGKFASSVVRREHVYWIHLWLYSNSVEFFTALVEGREVQYFYYQQVCPKCQRKWKCNIYLDEEIGKMGAK